MAAQFEDIRIVGLNNDATRSINGALCEVHFSLSVAPPWAWVHFFDAAYQSARSNMWRRAKVQGNDIVLSCGLDEIEKYHKQPLVNAVAAANRSYIADLQRLEQEKAEEIERQMAERDQINAMGDNLKFD